MENIHDEAQNTKEVLEFLAGCYEDFNNIISIPIKFSRLEKEYNQYFERHILKQIFRKVPTLKNEDSERVKMLAAHYVLNQVKIKNYHKLQEVISKNIESFLEQLDLFTGFDIDHITEYLQNNYEKSDNLLDELAEKKNKSGKANSCKPNLQLFFQKVEGLFSTLVVYQQLLYYKYEMEEFYLSRVKDLKIMTMEKVTQFASSKHSTWMDKVEKVSKKISQQANKEFDSSFKENLSIYFKEKPEINSFIDSYHSTSRYLMKTFKENVSLELGEPYRCSIKLLYSKIKTKC